MQVDVVVLTCNAGDLLSRLGQALVSQRGRRHARIIVIDSGSTDGSPERARAFADRIEGIPRAGFNHGSTRDLGARLAESDYVAFLSHDAVPVDEHWLDELVAPLERQPNVAAAWSRHVPRPGHPPWVQREVEESPNGAPDERLISHTCAADGGTRAARSLWLANTSSVYRRALLLDEPFGPASFGEDKLWQKRMMARGWDFFYAARSMVAHSHDLGFLPNLRRWQAESRLWRLTANRGPGGSSRLACLAMPVLGWLPALRSAARTPLCLWPRLISYYASANVGHFLGCL